MILTEPANRLTTRLPAPAPAAPAQAAALPAPAPAAAAAPVDLAECRWETVACSPDREFIHRAERWGWPEPISDAVVAALLQKTTGVTVRADGIRTTIGKERCHFWAEDSQLIHQAIQGPFEAIAKFDPDDLSCLHLFRHVGQDDALEYVETIARYVPPHMLDAEAQAKVLAAKRRQIRFVLDELQELHAADTQRASDRDLSNADKIQRVRTFPISHTADPSTAPATTRRAAEAPAATGGSSLQERAEREAAAANPMGGVVATGMQPRRFDTTPSESITGAVPPRASAPTSPDSGLVTPIGSPLTAPLPALAETLYAKQAAASAAYQAETAAAPRRAQDDLTRKLHRQRRLLT